MFCHYLFDFNVENIPAAHFKSHFRASENLNHYLARMKKTTAVTDRLITLIVESYNTETASFLLNKCKTFRQQQN